MITQLIYSPNNTGVSVIRLKFDDGGLLTSPCTLEQAEYISSHTELTQEEVVFYLNPEIKEAIEENKKVEVELTEVLSDERFYVKNNSLYRKGIDLSIPKGFKDRILNEIKNGNNIDHLDKLWMWTSLIFTPEARNSFYNYVEKNNLIITKQGFIVLFRRAHYRGQDKEMVDFVTNNYLRLRNNKKSTNVPVFKIGKKYSLKPEEGWTDSFKESLKELYNNLAGEADYFESNHSGPTGPVKYKIGEKASLLAIEDCDYSTATCSRGYHAACKEYNFSGYGDSLLVVVINPAMVVSCPEDYSSKMRVRTFLPITTLKSESELKDFELSEGMEDMIEEYFQEEIANMQSDLENQTFEEYSKHEVFKNTDVLKNVLDTIVETNVNVKDRLIKL